MKNKTKRGQTPPLVFLLERVFDNTTPFLFALLGAVTEGWHMYHIIIIMSSLEGWQRIVQAIIASVFFGGGLLFFITKRKTVTGTDRIIKYDKAINLFTSLGIYVNLYYWLSNIVILPLVGSGDDYNNINWAAPQYYKLLIAVPLSVLIPKIMKRYGGEVSPPNTNVLI